MTQIDSNKNEPVQSEKFSDGDKDIFEEAMIKYEWERQYFHTHDEPSHAARLPLILLGGLIMVAVLIIFSLANFTPT